MYVHAFVCMHAYICVRMCVRVCVCVCARARVCVALTTVWPKTLAGDNFGEFGEFIGSAK